MSQLFIIWSDWFLSNLSNFRFLIQKRWICKKYSTKWRETCKILFFLFADYNLILWMKNHFGQIIKTWNKKEIHFRKLFIFIWPLELSQYFLKINQFDWLMKIYDQFSKEILHINPSEKFFIWKIILIFPLKKSVICRISVILFSWYSFNFFWIEHSKIQDLIKNRYLSCYEYLTKLIWIKLKNHVEHRVSFLCWCHLHDYICSSSLGWNYLYIQLK